MRRFLAGFSLVEVVLAVAVFLVGIVAMLALLPGQIRRQADAAATHAALALPDAIKAELRARAGGNLAALHARLAEADAGAGAALRLVAARDGAGVRELRPVEAPRREHYFLIELFRFPAGSPVAYEPGAAFLAVHVRVSWPYRTAAAEGIVETPADGRQSVAFNVVFER